MGWGGEKGGDKGWGKGKGKGKGKDDLVEDQGYDDNGEELIWNAVHEACRPILRFEKELDENKLEKRIRDSFRKGAKGMGFHGKPWQELVNEYADTVFSAVFSSLGDREWLSQCDMLLCLDAGVKDNFPKSLIARIPQTEFERVVLQAHDRAFDQNRVMPVMWDVVQGCIDGPKGKKKVYNSMEEAWKEAHATSHEPQEFLWRLIDGTVGRISALSGGTPEWVMEPQLAFQLFDQSLQAGAMPMSLVQNHGPPPPRWPAIRGCVEEAYANHTVDENGVPTYIAAQKGKGMKGKGKGKDKGKDKGYGGGKGKGKKEKAAETGGLAGDDDEEPDAKRGRLS